MYLGSPSLQAPVNVTIAGGTLTVTQGNPPWQENLVQVGSANITLGQKTSANSFPVVLASDQATINVSVQNATLAVTQSGSWTVTANQGTANATPWNENIARIGGNAVVTAGASGVIAVGGKDSEGVAPGANPVPVGIIDASGFIAYAESASAGAGSAGGRLLGTGILGWDYSSAYQRVKTDSSGKLYIATVDTLTSITNTVNVNVTNATLAVTQSGTWNIGTVTTLSQFPSTAALADTTANPTLTEIQTFPMLFNGTTWDRTPGDKTNGVFVNIKSGNITGFATSANQTNASQKTQIVDGSGNVIASTSNALNVNVQNATLAVTQSGNWSTRTQDGSGTAITSNSTTTTSTTGLDINIRSILNTAPTSAGKLDVKGADGDVFVRQATGSNLHVVLDSGTLTSITNTVTVAGNKTNNNAAPGATNIGALIALANAAAPTWNEGDEVLASVDLAGNLRTILNAETTKVIGTVNQGTSPWVVGAPTATGAGVPANAFYEGVRGSTALPASVSDGQLVGAIGDKFGRQIVVLETVRDLKTNITPLTLSTTSETTLIGQVASTFLDITGIIVNNTSTTAVRVDFRDSTGGTIQFFIEVPAQETRGFMNGFFKQTTVNNNWTAQLSTAVTDVRISGTYVSNK